MTRTRNPLGWGYIEDALGTHQRKKLISAVRHLFNCELDKYTPPPQPGDVPILRAYLEPPESLGPIIATDHASSLLHAAGRSFRDLAILRSGDPVPAPDVVATPRTESELSDVLAWATDAGIAVIPYGGGSSATGGVNPENLEDWSGVVTLDLQQLNQVLEINKRDRIIHTQAGILGPDLDMILKPYRLSSCHDSQSYFHSTVGGWVATRGSGHLCSPYTSIEDRIQALSVMLPDGRTVETRPLPASSIGPDPNRLWCGSEGVLGVIVDVRLRVMSGPTHTHHATIAFDDFESALEATRTIAQADLWPSQISVLDPLENMFFGTLNDSQGEGTLMILGFADKRSTNDDLCAAVGLAHEFGGAPREDYEQNKNMAQPSSWRSTFFQQPYYRDVLLDYAVIMDTLETAVPWSAVPEFYHSVRQSTLDAIRQVTGASGAVTCRVANAYSDGVALQFTIYAPGHHGSLVGQSRDIKLAAADAVLAAGGTIGRHGGMGRDHKPWARDELPRAFQDAIRGAKQKLDPQGVMNPGLWFGS